ncbi:MAG: MBL fold metallo-hydrolase [Candidatus Levybacteria bacterium]|nr:MBL fold metallo-hydrolase [Candidatus Levybacteria bacterium]
MKKLKFLGASGEVTGSSFLLTADDESQLLVDFGMFQGPKEIANLNYQPLQFNPSQVKGVVLTHAHLDHCGRLPLLVYGGFSGKIYMTAPTFDLVEVILTDSAKIAQEKVDVPPLYGLEEVEKVLKMVEIVQYDTPVTFGPFTANFVNAGHILGSASIEIVDRGDGRKIVFSGDLGNTPEDIIRPTDYIDSADIVVMESTYGDKTHPNQDPSQVLLEEINAVERDSGVLLVPAFSLERTQEILHRIYHLKKEGKIRADTPVFMDSPMGIRATEIFRLFKEFYNEELQQHKDDPFSFEGLAVTSEARDSKDIIKAMDPKVIVAGSGMLSGGRILHHAMNYLPVATTRLLFVGYQAEDTLGRKILEGMRNVRIYDRNIKVRAHIRETTMSSHADQPKLMTWIKHIEGVKKVFVIHGDTEQRMTFAQKVEQDTKIAEIILPMNGEEYPL